MAAQGGLQINLNNLKDRVCECGGTVFTPALILKELPAILSSSRKAESLVIQTGFACIKCGAIMSLRPENGPDQSIPSLTN